METAHNTFKQLSFNQIKFFEIMLITWSYRDLPYWALPGLCSPPGPGSRLRSFPAAGAETETEEDQLFPGPQSSHSHTL